MTSTPPPAPIWDATSPDATVGRYAGFWLRVLAAIIDGVVLAILSRIVEFFLPSPPPPQFHDVHALMAYAQAAAPPAKLIANGLIAWAYFAFQESSSAEATIGKRMLGIRVTTEDGNRLSLAGASFRAWPMYLPNAGFLLLPGVGWLIGLGALVSCLVVAFSSRKQGLHDKMAGAILTRR